MNVEVFRARPAFILLALTSILFLASSVAQAIVVDTDYFDGFNHLLQARRLVDSRFEDVVYDGDRPSSMVLLLAIMLGLGHAATGAYPSIHVLHFLMLAIASAAFGAWFLVLRRMFSGDVAAYAISLAMGQRLAAHFSFFVLPDFVSSLGWALFYFLLPTAKDASRCHESRRYALVTALAAGVLGAAMSLTKNHFALVPLHAFMLHILLTRVATASKALAAKAVPMTWYAAALASFLAVFEILNRMASSGDRGIAGFIAHVAGQAAIQVKSASPAHLYGHSITIVLGPLALFLVAGAALEHRAIRAAIVRPDNEAARRVSYLVLTIVYVLLLQLVHHKEARYLLPHLPVGLAIGVLGLMALWQRLRRLRLILGTAMAASWVWMVAGTVDDVRRTLTEPIYDDEQSGMAALLRAINVPGSKQERCQELRICDLTRGLRPAWSFEVPDSYYRAFHLAARIAYEAEMPTTARFCAGVPNPLAAVATLGRGSDPWSTCYLVPTPDGNMEHPVDRRVAFLRPIAMGIDREAGDRLRSSTSDEVSCVPLVDGAVDCFQVTRYVK